MFGKFSTGRSWWLSPWPWGSSLRRLRCEHPFLPTSLLGVALRRFQRLHRCHRQIPLDGHRSGCQLSCYHVMFVMFVYSTHLYTPYTRVERCGKHCLKNLSLVDVENGPVVIELMWFTLEATGDEYLKHSTSSAAQHLGVFGMFGVGASEALDVARMSSLHWARRSWWTMGQLT